MTEHTLDLAAVFAPIFGMLLVAFIIGVIAWLYAKRMQYIGRPDRDYQQLAKEAIAQQETLLRETQKLHEAVADIKRLLDRV